MQVPSTQKTRIVTVGVVDTTPNLSSLADGYPELSHHASSLHSLNYDGVRASLGPTVRYGLDSD
jgi:hypothetical protein